MRKNKMRKNNSVEEVKKALNLSNIQDFNMNKMTQFISMIPSMDKEVAMETIKQFPNFIEFGETAIAEYNKICEKLLADNKDSNQAAIRGYQTILDSLSKRLEHNEISENESKAIVDDMIMVANKIAEIDEKNKVFLGDMRDKSMVGFAFIIGAAIAILGVKNYGTHIKH